LLPELDDAADDSFAVPKFLTKDEVKYVVWWCVTGAWLLRCIAEVKPPLPL
jgi:hypothetical protein